jgi:hypothetical protein
MNKTFIVIAAVAVLASSSAQARYLSKGQVCKERSVKETFPVAMRDACRGHGKLTKCKRLIDEWLAAAVLKTRNCITARG